MIDGSSASTDWIATGRWRRPASQRASAAGVSWPRCLASVSVSRNNAANCVVNAFVDATPISAPARVRYVNAVCRTIELVATLQIVKVW